MQLCNFFIPPKGVVCYMKSVKLKNIIYISFILIIATCNVSAVEILNFGKFKAVDEMVVKTEIYPLHNRDFDQLDIWLENEFVSQKNNKTLSIDRLKIIADGGPIDVRNYPVKVAVSKTPLIFTFEVFPEDLPGRYESFLHIKYKEIEKRIKIKLQIEQWLSLKKKTNKTRISRSNKNKMLSSDTPIILEIASNAPWQLKAWISNKNILPFNQKIKVLNEEQSEIYLSREETPLISGETTVNEKKYAKQIQIILKIENFHKLQAGKINFPIHFKLYKLN